MRQILLFLLFNISTVCGFAQDIQAVLKRLEKKSTLHPQEKLYLHLDKSSYAAGETIWFKAYSTMSIHNVLSNLSGIAYVELINHEKEIVNSLTIPLMMGVGLGDISLSDTIAEGSYRLRAYTKWMENAGEDFFYDRTIHISNGRSDNVMTNTVVEYGDKDNIYNIELKTLSGVPLVKSRVSYEVIFNNKSVVRKKVTSDELGKIAIPIEEKYTDGILNLSLENKDKWLVRKQIKLITLNAAHKVELLPEGGKLLAGRINVLGVKSINSKGLGVPANLSFIIGTDTLGNVSTNVLGMGAASLFLNDTTQVKAHVTFEDGTKQIIDLPKIYDMGYSMVINNMNENRMYAQVNVSSDLIDNSEIYFVAHHLGSVLFVSKQKVNKDEFIFSLEKKPLPNGVITISVLNDKFLPITERAVFHYNEYNVFPGAINLDKKNYTTREKVKVQLANKNNADSTKIGAFSASVIDLGKITDSVSLAPNIFSSLLLSADIKGYIEKPGYYFADGEIKLQDLDYLMLTQGWRNIDWNSLGIDEEIKYKVEKSIQISGYTKKLGRSKPEPNAKVQLISTKNFMDYLDTVSNEEGYFSFDNILFPDSVKFLISARDDKKGKNNIDIVFNKRQIPAIGSNRNEAEVIWDINGVYNDQLKNVRQYFAELEGKGLKEKSIAIEEVFVTRERPKAAPNSSNLNGSGNADQIITAEELSTCVTLDMCLSGRLMGVTWQNGIPYNTRGNVPMQAVLDGMYIEGDQIAMINVTDIESVEVLRNVNYTAIYGQYGANGLIIITSKTGLSAMRSNVAPKGLLTIQPQGIYVNKTFYKPEYDIADGLKFTNDVRTTLHWEPSIVTDKDGKANFDFFTSDSKGKYLIIIEGVDLSGRLLRLEKQVIVH